MRAYLNKIEANEDKKRQAVTLMTFVILLVAFSIAPLPGGDDWETLINASRRFVRGEQLYGVLDPHYYANPPWFAAALIPLSWLPFRISFALLMVSSILLSLRVLRRWNPESNFLKPALTVLSPPMFYLLLHGEVDMLILGGILLPTQYWGLIAVTKPQVAIGLLLNIKREKYIQAVLIAGLVVLLSFILLGNWVSDWLDHSAEIRNFGQNYWLGLWPFQIPMGAFFLVQGIHQKDERLLAAGSPFVSPYAAPSSFIGTWLVALSYLNNWQSLALFASWWGAIILRAVG